MTTKTEARAIVFPVFIDPDGALVTDDGSRGDESPAGWAFDVEVWQQDRLVEQGGGDWADDVFATEAEAARAAAAWVRERSIPAILDGVAEGDIK